MEKALRKTLKHGKFENVPEKRSRTMSNIKAKGNKTTEIAFRMLLIRSGIKGWKLHSKDLVGNPDFFFPETNLAIFLDGCFWHGCPKCGHIPKKNKEYWAMKIQRNKQRDRQKRRALRKQEIRVLSFWEHEIKYNLPRCINKLRNALMLIEN